MIMAASVVIHDIINIHDSSQLHQLLPLTFHKSNFLLCSFNQTASPFFCSKRKLIPWLRLILRNQTILETFYTNWSYVVKTGISFIFITRLLHHPRSNFRFRRCFSSHWASFHVCFWLTRRRCCQAIQRHERGILTSSKAANQPISHIKQSEADLWTQFTVWMWYHDQKRKLLCWRSRLILKSYLTYLLHISTKSECVPLYCSIFRQIHLYSKSMQHAV